MSTTLAARVVTTDRLERTDLDAVAQLVDAAADADGVHPLSEHVMLHLRLGGEGPARHLLAFVPDVDIAVEPDLPGQPGRLAAYAHLDTTDEVEGSSSELVVHPGLRRRGVGRLLVHSLEHASPDGRLRLWAHGQLAGAQALAASLGYERSRELWQMRRSLYAPLPAVELPTGFELRAFRPGSDDESWLAVNGAAFAHHPEQGGWSLQDLHARMDEPWFDAAGFLLLTDTDGEIAGFHWTKVHGGDTAEADGDGLADRQGQDHGHEPIGEVYVVAVAPAFQGRRLGRPLTVAGLRHLRQHGLAQAMLYVDADNDAAIRTYTALGFTRWDVDAMFARPTARGPGLTSSARSTRRAPGSDTITT